MEDPNEPTKVTILMPRYAKRSLKEEAARRDMTMGAIILEALKSRIMFIDRTKTEARPGQPEVKP